MKKHELDRRELIESLKLTIQKYLDMKYSSKDISDILIQLVGQLSGSHEI